MSILLAQVNKHLGDTPTAFLDVPYAGLVFEIPVTVTWVDENAQQLELLVKTQEVETWGEWAGHPVSVNDKEIGRVKDSNNAAGQNESTVMSFSKSLLGDPIQAGSKFRLAITVDKKNSDQVGFLDDFLLTAYFTNGFAAKVGW